MSIKDELSSIKKEGIIDAISSFVDIKKLMLGFLILAFGIYVGILLFGNNNLITLINLREQRELLQEKVEALNKENAKLQKEYFEMQLIEKEE